MDRRDYDVVDDNEGWGVAWPPRGKEGGLQQQGGINSYLFSNMGRGGTLHAHHKKYEKLI